MRRETVIKKSLRSSDMWRVVFYPDAFGATNKSRITGFAELHRTSRDRYAVDKDSPDEREEGEDEEEEVKRSNNSFTVLSIEDDLETGGDKSPYPHPT